MSSRSLLLCFPLCAALALTACGGSSEADHEAPQGDPALAAALEQPIMVDPDLVALNRASNVAGIADGDGMVPQPDLDPAAAGRARSAAIELVGGPAAMKSAREPRDDSQTSSVAATGSLAERAAALPADRGCIDALSYSAVWAARMPEAFPVYPQANVRRAAGVASADCALRAVSFVTSVSASDVMDFYFTRASHAGFSARHTLKQDGHVLSGSRGSASFAVYAATDASGATSAYLVTSGK